MELGAITEERPVARRRGGLGRLLRPLVWAAIVLVLLPVVLVPIYAVVPPVSTPMLARWLTLQGVSRDWTPLDAISPELVRAVVSAEDARYCGHDGVDWAVLRDVIEEAGEDGPARGASTIPMQTAKNLFLWQGAGYLRKPIEIALALWIDMVLGKRRTMEIYLNIAEWGPDGVFGAEAGARRAFGEPAARLSSREAAIMAAALPNPIVRDPRRPTRAQLRRAGTVASRARAGADLSCVLRR